MLLKAITVSVGTFVSQLLPFLALPLLTRLFTKEHFGEFALYFSIVTVTSMFLTFKLEQIIILSKNKCDMESRVRAILSQILILFLIITLTFILNTQIQSYISLPLDVFFLIPFGSLFLAFILCVNCILLWHEHYKYLALIKILNSILYVTLAIFIGFNYQDKDAVNGLIYGWFSGQLIVCLVAIILINYRTSLSLIPKLNFTVYRDFKDIVFLNFPSSLIDRVSQEVPIFFISNIYGVKNLGDFNMVTRILGSPIALVGTAISQVLLKEISSRTNARQSITKVMLKAFTLLLITSTIVFIIFTNLTAEHYRYILGNEWGNISVIVQILLPSFAFKLIVVPLSSVLLPLRKLVALAIWQVTFFLSTLYLFLFVEQSFIQKLNYLVMMEMIVYLLYLFIIIFSVKKYEHNLMSNG